jgi:hypothetical protein
MVTFRGTAVALITRGNNTTGQNIFALINNWNSNVNVDIRRMNVQNNNGIVLTTVMPIVKTCRVAAHTIKNGGVISKGSFDTSLTSDPGVEAKISIDTSINIDAVPGDFFWQQYTTRMHTLIGQVTSWDNNILPRLIEDTDFILRPGQALLVQVTANTNASNADTVNNFWVEAMWEEKYEPSHILSGETRNNAGVILGGCDVRLLKNISGQFIPIATRDDKPANIANNAYLRSFDDKWVSVSNKSKIRVNGEFVNCTKKLRIAGEFVTIISKVRINGEFITI